MIVVLLAVVGPDLTRPTALLSPRSCSKPKAAAAAAAAVDRLLIMGIRMPETC
jgi:hypothetical protein